MRAGKIDSRQVKKAYQAYVSLNQVQRLEALRQLVNLFEVVVPFLRRNWGPTREAAFVRSQKTKPLGFAAGTPYNEAENALLFTVRFLEKAVEDQALPTLAAAEASLLEVKRKEEEEAKRRTARFDSLLGSLAKTLGLNFRVEASAAKSRSFDPSGTVVFSPAYAEEVYRVYQANPLQAILGECPIALKARNLSRNDSGQVVVDYNRALGLLPEVVMNILAEVGNGTGRSRTVKPASATTATPKTPRVPKAPRPVSISGDLFRQGTKFAEVWERLKASGGTTTMPEIFRGLNAGDPRRMLGVIAEKGKATGLFDLSFQPKTGQVTLVFR